jgi:hypothetical protein
LKVGIDNGTIADDDQSGPVPGQRRPGNIGPIDPYTLKFPAANSASPALFFPLGTRTASGSGGAMRE